MTTFPGSPRLIKGGIVLIDPETSAVQRTITLQYNPDTITRTLRVQGAGSEDSKRSEALRLYGTPIETLNVDAIFDATDQLEFQDENPNAIEYGIHPHLAVLESIIYPKSSQLLSNNGLAQSGTLEVIPMQAPLTLFIWNKNRTLPVRLTDFSITEEAFDTSLNPIRAKVSLGMRVLSVDDLGFNHKGGNLFMAYLQQKEQFAAKGHNVNFSNMGIRGIP